MRSEEDQRTFASRGALPASSPPTQSAAATQAPPAPISAQGRTEPTRPWVAIIAICSALALVVATIVTVAIISTKGAGTVHFASVPVTTAAVAPNALPPSKSAATARELKGGTPNHPTAVPAVGEATARYHSAGMTAEIPGGWSIQENSVAKTNYVESKWSRGSAYILIDESPPTHLTPQQDAEPVHEGLLRTDGYHEIYYGSADLSNVNAWMWVFAISGDERVDYFFEKCTNTFGVLGSAPPAQFQALRARFRAVASSVQSTCE